MSYEVVRELVPKLWSDAGDRGEDDVPDIVLHIGMAGPRPFYQIERRGHREGYRSPDVDGRFLEDEEEGGHGEGWIWYGCPDELETQLDMPDVLERWKTHSPVCLPFLSQFKEEAKLLTYAWVGVGGYTDIR